MWMPDPDNERRSMPISDFLDRMKDDDNREQYQHIISALPPFLNEIKTNWLAIDGIPEIRIITNASANETELRDIVNTVCLAEGLLERSLGVQSIAEKSLGTYNVPRPLGPLSVAKACIMWSCAHEIFHYLRRHALIEKHFGSTPETKHALEFDADLCAAAAFYRYLQRFSTKVPSIHLKKTAFRLLYFSLRINLAEENIKWAGSATHPHTAARLMDILSKLAMMHNTGVADQNFEDPFSHLHLAKLTRLLIDLESHYPKETENKTAPRASEVIAFAKIIPTLSTRGLEILAGTRFNF